MERYRSFHRAMEKRFGRKIYKLALDAGMTCPNRDGTLGVGGCIFCDGGSGAFAEERRGSLEEQLSRAKARVAAKAGERAGYMAYFQSYTNTYAPAAHLLELYLPIVRREDIQALSIATRPDCLPPEVLSVLADLAQEKPLFVELGLQTVHEDTARYIRRGYELSVFEQAVQDLRSLGAEVVVHTIFGLPGETPARMRETVEYVAHSGVQGIKLQLLHVLRGTELATAYARGEFSVMEMADYIALVEDAIRLLPPEMVIHRLTGDGEKAKLLAPLWSADKKRVLNAMQRAFVRDDVRQGQWYRED